MEGVVKVSWYNIIHLEQWAKKWRKINGKCRELIIYEGIILQKESEGRTQYIQVKLMIYYWKQSS